MGHDPPIDARHSRYALRPTAVEKRPRVRSDAGTPVRTSPCRQPDVIGGDSFFSLRRTGLVSTCRVIGISAKSENTMRKLMMIVGAAATGLWVMAASASEVTGTISNIDLLRNTFIVQGIYFVPAPNN